MKESQMPSTCLRRSGYAQAGQMPNNIEFPMTKIQKKDTSQVIGFGYWNIGLLEFVWYLEFGAWDFYLQGAFNSSVALTV
jgi:hypothetical protein